MGVLLLWQRHFIPAMPGICLFGICLFGICLFGICLFGICLFGICIPVIAIFAHTGQCGAD
jgi:hypothetical protein